MKKAIVMLSGGPDSLALLHMISSSYDQIYCVYVNEPMDSESIIGSEYAKKAALKFGCVFKQYEFPESCSLSDHHKAIKWSMYQAAIDFECNEIYFGHNKDDLYENMLLGLFKNMPHNCMIEEVRIDRGLKIYRPLITKTKKQIMEYCDECGFLEGLDYYHAKINNSENDIRGILRNSFFKKLHALKDYEQYLNSLFKSIEKMISHKKHLLNSSALCAKRFKNMAANSDSFLFYLSNDDMSYFNKYIFIFMVRNIGEYHFFSEKDSDLFENFFLVKNNFGKKLTVNSSFYVTVEQCGNGFIIYGGNVPAFANRDFHICKIKELENGMAI